MSFVFSADEVFSMAMQIEKSGFAYYKTVADSTNDNSLKELFEYLAKEEQRHYAFFEKLDRQTGGLSVSDEEWEQISEYIKATTETRFFIGEEKTISLSKKPTDVKDAIDIAIGFEKDTLLFFYELRQITPAGSQEAADKIIEEEKRHVMRLTEKRREFGVQ